VFVFALDLAPRRQVALAASRQVLNASTRALPLALRCYYYFNFDIGSKFKQSHTNNKNKMRVLKSHVLLRLLNSYLVDSPQPSNLSYM